MKKLLVIMIAALGLFSLIVYNANEKLLCVPSYKIEEGNEVVLTPDQFINSNTTYSADQLTIESELMTNKEKFDYNETTHTVTSHGKTYLEAGDYEVVISTKDGTVGCLTTLTVSPLNY